MATLVDRIEEILEQRAMSKQQLAASLGMSRQTLWRRLSQPERIRVAELDQIARALSVSRERLLTGVASFDAEVQPAGQWEPEPDRDAAAAEAGEGKTLAGQQLEDFGLNMDRIVRTLSSATSGAIDQRVKVAILDGIEQVARETGNKLPPEYWDLRRRVVHGEL